MQVSPIFLRKLFSSRFTPANEKRQLTPTSIIFAMIHYAATYNENKVRNKLAC